MADMDNNSALVSAVTSHVEMNGSNEEASQLDSGIVDQVDVDVTDEEMLQTALADASSAFPAVQYNEETEALHDGALINNGIQFINDSTGSQDNTDHLAEGFVGETSVNFINETDFVIQEGKTDVIKYHSEHSEGLEDSSNSVLHAQLPLNANVSQPQIIVQQHLPQSSAPLGSSQNPIRIIQQGNQYTPVQQLSTDQLQQIMQVVQQQQIGKNIATGSSVLFNPQTNTRIVYRVIYPSQLHKDGAGDSTRAAGQQTVMSSVPRKTYKKRIKEEEIDRIEGPELSKEEKEQRKKMRPKTRSGRVSKPPKHMVKDFKHIHVLDYDEDYDDSDGGYSDFKYEGEDEPDRKDDDDNFVTYATGVDSMKPKRWKCITCEKAYIGRAGLGRHLKLNPSHGSIDLEGDGDMEPPDPNITPVSSEDMTPSTPATPNGINSTANSTASFSEDSRDSSVSLTYTPTPRRGRGRGRSGRGGWRGRGAYNKVDPETRRLNKLKEITRECSDEELMEIVLPRLAKVITLWEFLLMKVEKGNPAWPHADDIYKEYEKLHEHVKKLCKAYLQFVSEPETVREQHQSLLQVENKDIAQALGLHVGPHKVREIADTDSDIQYKYKLLTTNQSVDFDYTNKSFLKRTVEVVSPEQIVSPAKKLKHLQPQSNIVTISHPRNLYSSAKSTSISVTSANSTPISGVNSVPFISKIKVVSPQKMNGSVSQCSNSGKPTSGKTVSLLTNSFSKHSQSSSSLSSLSSSSSDRSSQKVIIVSGTNSTPQSSASTFTSSSVPVKNYLPGPLENQSGNQLHNQSENQLNNQSGEQFVTLSNGQGLNSQNRIILHDSVTGTYTVCSVSNNLTNPSQASIDVSQNSTSQPVILSLPPSSNPQLMQPKLVLNDMNLLNSVPSETSEFQQIITSVAGENIVNRQILNVKSGESLNVNPVTSIPTEGISVTDLDQNEQNLILTLPNGDPVRLTGSDQNSTGDVVYALTNGDSSNENVIFTVDPNSMLVTELNSDQSNEAANGIETINGDQVLQTNGDNEVVGVINSIDTSETVKELKSMEQNTNMAWEIVENVSPNEDTQQAIDTTQMNGNALISDASLNENHTSMAAIDNCGDKINNIEPKMNNEYEVNTEDSNPETIQIPATNIYQTEDGLIFIQNPDGTTLQLQGSDGQAVSMETVQALLGMETETSQLTTEQNAT
ncbi:uncharacterized protein LOC123545005 [Mercenaria mercenaria]|uniref:uncharacterized protein LOC123545005 n=1 Tax=Mercenaria mercenaria TaxID=6596 RepID=UPI00234ED338|nr:uncharacterized protein LOC123545005 [Mercenaria mercenaria]